MRSPLRQERDPPTGASVRHAAEAAAAVLPPLLVAAERIAATVAQGVHGRRRVGQGDSFWQFRRYQPGDPAQSIDWRQSAKSQHAFIRENEWEAAQSVWLWRDGSASMNYRSDRSLPDKLERANVLTLALASLLVRGGERIALLGGGGRPAGGRASLNRLANQLLGEDRREDSLPGIEPLPRFSNLVMIGDFLSPPEEVDRLVRDFAGGGAKGHLLQVLDPAEEGLPFRGRIQFEGMEGEGAALIGRVEMVREEYVGLMHRHREALTDITRSVGWTFSSYHTDRPPQAALLALYGALAQAVVS